jgi:hypothetical protein
MIRETLATLLYNHGVENAELLDALEWKFKKIYTEKDMAIRERDRLREDRDTFMEGYKVASAERDRLREALEHIAAGDFAELAAENVRLREALEKILKAWQAEPDLLYRELRECWMVETMEPAIDAARAALAKEGQ